MKQNEIFKTNKYHLFKKLTGNRPLDPTNLNRIIKKMKICFVSVPIIVNEKMEVIDGQHRLNACEALELPVEYITRIGWGLKQAIEMNQVSKHWDMEDMAISQLEQGHKEYKTFLEFKAEFKFSDAACISMLLDVNEIGTTTLETFKTGKFKVKDLVKAKQYATQLIEIGKHFERWKKPKFVAAILSVFKEDKYNHKQFLHKLEVFPTLMVDCPNKQEFLKRIEYVFNYQAKGAKVRLF